jgi:hypothetical protein
MDYCKKGQWVTEKSGWRCGLVDTIVKRRDHTSDGIIIVQFGADGPFERRSLRDFREASAEEIREKTGE